MTRTIEGIRVAFMIANEGVEQVELQDPWAALVQAGSVSAIRSLTAGFT